MLLGGVGPLTRRPWSLSLVRSLWWELIAIRSRIPVSSLAVPWLDVAVIAVWVVSRQVLFLDRSRHELRMGYEAR